MRGMIRVAAGESPKRLDVFLTRQTAGRSRAAIQRAIAAGVITVDGRRARASSRLRPGTLIEWETPHAPRSVEPEPLTLHVLDEDEAIIVIDKPAGLVVHPAPGHWTGTLANALAHRLGERASASLAPTAREGPAPLPSAGPRGPALVHRLDKGTSGVMIAAKTVAAARHLARQFASHTIHRAYLALVVGRPRRRAGRIALALGRDAGDRRRVSAHAPRTVEAITEYRVVESFGRVASLVEVRPRTGRMHQIRAHLASIGHPIAGDAAYGGASACRLAGIEIARPMLHAWQLGLTHPGRGSRVEWEAAPPADLETLLSALRAERRGARAAGPDAEMRYP